MNPSIKHVNMEVYDKLEFGISNFQVEEESVDYKACNFKLHGFHFRERTAKITPKK
ncbi:MAG: hypothetical protein ACJAWO_002053 [Halieaceae bacterium]|jgi:hypothetical protein